MAAPRTPRSGESRLAEDSSIAELRVDVCVVGGGPAGLTLAVELARRGVEVAVLEKSSHFDRTFRGESLSPDSVWLLDQLGILARLTGKYVQMHRLEIIDGGRHVLGVEFDDFAYPHPYPVEMPQPDLLGALADAGAEEPGFRLLMKTSAVGLLRDDAAVTGVRARTQDGALNVRARVTVAADGRFSKVRELSGLAYERVPLERDVIWLRLPFPAGWDDRTYRIRIDGDQHALFLPTAPDSVRVGCNVPKGGLKQARTDGIEVLYTRIDRLAPELSGAVREHVRSWADTSALDIFTSTAPHWSTPGLVLIGDAAHTLTPILGQGVNHAIADAVALAPVLRAGLAAGDQQTWAALTRFQREREPAVARSRGLQLRQERLFSLTGRAAAGRRLLYRVVDSSRWLARRTLASAYFQSQQPGPRAVAKQSGPARTYSSESLVPIEVEARR